MKKNVAVLYTRPEKDSSQLAKAFEAADFDVLAIHDSESLYRIVNRQQIDAIVIENKLNSFLTGLETLSRLDQALVRPVTVLLGTLSEKEKASAKEGKVDYLFGWEASPNEIADACFRSCRWEANRGLFIPESARHLVRDADFLQPLPQLAVKIAKYFNDESATISDVASDISKDALATAEIFRKLNCSSAGLPNKVHRLQDAVSLLGIKQTVVIVLRFCIHRCQTNLLERLDADLISWFGVRSTMIASTASVFAQRCQDICPDMVYLLGLFQDIGMLALAHEYDSYFKIIQRYRTVPQVRLEMLEAEDYEITHADVTAAIMQQWQLPASFIRLILHHHNAESDSVDLSEMEHGVIRAMQIGEALANMQDYPSLCRFQRFEQLLRSLPNYDKINVKSCLGEAIAKASESADLYKTPIPDAKQWRSFVIGIGDQLAGRAPSRGFVEEAEIPTESPSPNTDSLPRLIVVDENPAIATHVRAALSEFAIDVEHWMTPKSCEELSSNICGIVCEAHFSNGSGISFIQRVRDYGLETPIIMMSQDRNRMTILKSIQAGINEFLTKPFSSSELIEKLQRQGILGESLATPQP
ncbi:HDOD domain-containing protein [Blastopirellula marina]|uniref:HDOD domain-containing protein n=1 Tax=Blastopirellula marina DSM 3645 TaxID=314230 RepID=A4A2F3_9BACT|nr:HDOD domain-containing protein [Blastopirellula marina]EAQ77067.1 hypothetical protein DSM3645_25136 [Blastopirellula marina DSM 3645]